MPRPIRLLSRLVGVSALTWVSQAGAQNPFPEDKATTGHGTPSPGPTNATAPESHSEALPSTVQTALDCSFLTRERCIDQNPMLLATAGIYVGVLLLLTTLWRIQWMKQLGNAVLVRFWTPGFLGAAASGLLVWFDPARSGDLICCLATPDFNPVIWFHDLTVARAFALGVGPFLVLYVLVAAVTRRLGW